MTPSSENGEFYRFFYAYWIELSISLLVLVSVILIWIFVLSKVPSKRRRFRLVFRLSAILVATVATFVVSVMLEQENYHMAAIPMLFILATSIIEFIVADIITDTKFPKRTADLLERLEARLHDCDAHVSTAINEFIKKMDPTGTEHDITGTFHLEVDKYTDGATDETETALVQIIKYTGGVGGKQWRITPVTKGIIGRCLRTQKQEYVNFKDEDEFKSRMVSEFGFTKEELSKVTGKARSYCAHPVSVNDRTVGVLYLFSTRPEVFPKAVERSDIGACCDRISAYLLGARILSHGI